MCFAQYKNDFQKRACMCYFARWPEYTGDSKSVYSNTNGFPTV